MRCLIVKRLNLEKNKEIVTNRTCLLPSDKYENLMNWLHLFLLQIHTLLIKLYFELLYFMRRQWKFKI
jgi:hypothetical protein